MLKSERRLWMREFSDLNPFDDIPASFLCFQIPLSATLAARSQSFPSHDHRLRRKTCGGKLTLKQIANSRNRDFTG
jgi:hypothetical protein